MAMRTPGSQLRMPHILSCWPLWKIRTCLFEGHSSSKPGALTNRPLPPWNRMWSNPPLHMPLHLRWLTWLGRGHRCCPGCVINTIGDFWSDRWSGRGSRYADNGTHFSSRRGWGGGKKSWPVLVPCQVFGCLHDSMVCQHTLSKAVFVVNIFEHYEEMRDSRACNWDYVY